MTNDNRARTPREKFDLIDRRRRDEGLSIDALCGAAGITSRSWYRIARGDSEPRGATLRKLRRALDRLLAETIDPEDA